MKKLHIFFLYFGPGTSTGFFGGTYSEWALAFGVT